MEYCSRVEKGSEGQQSIQENDFRPLRLLFHLRMLYWSTRMNSLGKKAEVANCRTAAMRSCLEFLKKQHPDAEFVYDKAFFRA